MVVSIVNWSRSQAMARPAQGASPFGALLADLRVAARLTQHGLASRAGIDSSYVNRLERQPAPPGRISRAKIVRLWLALDAEADDLDRLLASAGLLPESVLEAGGWDAYLRTWRGQIAVLERKLELRDVSIRRQSRELLALREGRSG
ncbi:MAG TPA: helix-turn-helix transcriptional regulator [Acidimicrobiales bacterium]